MPRKPGVDYSAVIDEGQGAPILLGETALPDCLMGLIAAPNGVFVVTAEGRLFQRVRDPKNFDGRNPDKWIWVEPKVPGPVSLAVLTPKGDVMVLLKDGRLMERTRDSAVITQSWVWKDIPSPLT